MGKIYNILVYIPTKLITSFLIILDDMFSIFFSSEFITEKFFGVFLFIITVVLGIDSDSIDNETVYKKKYILMLYTIIILTSLTNRIMYNINGVFILILLILFLTMISALNIGYRFGTLEKQLSILEFLNYTFKSWFYKAKTYIIFYLIIVLYILNKKTFEIEYVNVSLTYGKEIINCIIIIIFLFIHLTIDVKDRFDFYGFEEMFNKLDQTRNIIIESENRSLNSILKIEDDNYDAVELLGLLLYIEDRDYLSRKLYTYSIITVLKRKIKDENIIIEIIKKYKNRKENSNENKTISNKIRWFFYNIKRAFNKVIKLLLRKLKNLFRGYSTIEQQVIRTTVMKPYSYNYLFRRKFFIERVYLKSFVAAYKTRKIKNRNKHMNILNFFKGTEKRNIEKEKKKYRKYIHYEIKMEILIYYYTKTYQNPKKISDLLNAISKESAQNTDILRYKQSQYEDSDYKLYIEKQLLDIYGVIKGGGLKMRNEYYYDTFSKELYQKDNGEIKKKLADLSSSPKEFKNKIAYISPYDFETRNSIYVYDVKNKKKEEVLSWQEDKCPKDIEWYSEDLIYVLLGETYGTVDIGGDLYLLNIVSKTKTLVKKFPMNIQITEIELLNKKNLKVKGIKYIDDYMNESIPYKETIEI